jgi:ABC-type multidrug transport system fused ATPase/permease subunit
MTPRRPRVKPLRARELLLAHRWQFVIGGLLMLVNRASILAVPTSVQILVDNVIGQRRAGLLLPLAVGVGAATVVYALTMFAMSHSFGVAALRLVAEFRRRLAVHVLHLPVRYFDSTQSGTLISRVMHDPDGMRDLIGLELLQTAGSAMLASVAFVYLLYLNWRLTAITVAALAVLAAVMGYLAANLRPLFLQQREIHARVTGRLGEVFGGVRVIKAYSTEAREARAFVRGTHDLVRNGAQVLARTSGLQAIAGCVMAGVGVVLLLVGGRAMLAGTMTVGQFFNYVLLLGLLGAPFAQLASQSSRMSESLAGLDRIRELLNVMREDAGDADKQPLSSIVGGVRFESVSFEYLPGAPVLKEITFDAPAGTTTALVGRSGAGKSTLLSLVMAFHRPRSGRICIDGLDVACVRLSDLRLHVAVVLQENFLFDGSIADNIRYSRPEASLEEVRAVSRDAHAEEFIEAFEHKYDTIVGERGVKLSMGQRQRIAIARAMLSDRRILVLDEATSSLDSESEAYVQDALRALRRGRTTFVIAHRCSTVRSADQILVLENGRIIERGTHTDLLVAGGRYRALYDRQYADSVTGFDQFQQTHAVADPTLG